MKKIISILMVIVLMLSLVACGNSNDNNVNTNNDSDKGGDEKVALDFPKRAIEFIVPFGPGGSADMMTRQVANMLDEFVDKPVNVINKAGSGGIDGMNYVAQAPADGYTVLQITPSHAIAEALGRPNAELTGGFEPIGNFQKDIQVFGVTKDSPFNTIEELLEYAKENPGDLKIGGTSPGGLDNYMADGFADAAGVDITYVPYKAAAETKAAVLGGELDIYQDKIISFLTMVKSGDIKPLVVLHDERLDMIEELKDVPTTVEKGIEFTQGSWRGFAVKKGTPQEIKDYLADAIEKVYNSESYKETSEKEMSNIIPGYIEPEEYGKMWNDEIEKFKKILVK